MTLVESRENIQMPTAAMGFGATSGRGGLPQYLRLFTRAADGEE
jgi:hypothetical protein